MLKEAVTLAGQDAYAASAAVTGSASYLADEQRRPPPFSLPKLSSSQHPPLCPWHYRRQELRQRFPAKPWVDVLSKADLLEEEFDEADRQMAAGQVAQQGQQHVETTAAGGSLPPLLPQQEVGSAVRYAAALPSALRVSSTRGEGVDALKEAMMQMLEQHGDLLKQQAQPAEEAGQQPLLSVAETPA